MKTLLKYAFLLMLLPVGSFAQGGFAGFPGRMGGLFWHESDPVQECYMGTWHYVTYARFYLGSGNTNIFVRDYDSGEPCSCDVLPVTQFRPAQNSTFSSLRSAVENDPISALRPRQESNCKSGDGRGGSETVPGQQAAGSTGGFGGSGSAPSASAPDVREGYALRSPPPAPSPRFEMERTLSSAGAPRLAENAATSGSAFTYTLPFRDLPAGPLLAGVTSQVPWTCNAKINPTMFRVYHTDNVVTRYNMCTALPIATISVPSLPLQVRVTPDGSQAIVTSYSGAITFINTATNAVSSTIQMPSDPNFAPSGIAISPDSVYALVTNYLAPPYSYLAVVDLASRQIKGKIPLDNDYPQSVFINPDGTLAWVTYPWNNSVEIIDILTGALVQSLYVNEPFSIVFNPTGTRAFVSSGSGSVEVIDTATYQVLKTVAAGIGATDLQITPDGAFVYVNNSDTQSVTVVDTQTLNATTANVGAAPQGSALVPVQ